MYILLFLIGLGERMQWLSLHFFAWREDFCKFLHRLTSYWQSQGFWLVLAWWELTYLHTFSVRDFNISVTVYITFTLSININYKLINNIRMHKTGTCQKHSYHSKLCGLIFKESDFTLRGPGFNSHQLFGKWLVYLTDLINLFSGK